MIGRILLEPRPLWCLILLKPPLLVFLQGEPLFAMIWNNLVRPVSEFLCLHIRFTLVWALLILELILEIGWLL